jgi:hypothetical protein
MRARELIKRHSRMSDGEFLAAMDALDAHEKDLLIVCKACGAKEGAECKKTGKKSDAKLKKGCVHIGRRIGRLLKGIR